MNPKLHQLYLFAYLIVTAFGSIADEAEVKLLGKHQESPRASITDVAWIAGTWRGEAFGGTAEEIWSAPLDGTMMGAFKSSDSGKVSFYEFMVIRTVGESLVLQLKHFDADLTGWEEQDETVDFQLVEPTANAACFSGMTYLRVSKEEMHVLVQVGAPDDPPLKIVYRSHIPDQNKLSKPIPRSSLTPRNATASHKEA